MYQKTTTRQYKLHGAGDNYLMRSVASEEDHITDKHDAVSFNSLNSYAHTKPTLAKEALHGLAGDFVRSIEPFTEADPVAVLSNLLTAYGNIIGHRPHFKVGYTRHYFNLFVAQVGASSRGRKGTGWSAVGHTFQLIDKPWVEERITSGLSSGEGLIRAVRDQGTEKRPIKQKGRVVDYDVIV